MKGIQKNKLCKRGLAVLLAAFMVLGSLGVSWKTNVQVAWAAESVINSMSYYSATDGPVISHVGVESADYGFVMPIFNDGASTWQDVVGDLSIKVKVDGAYVDIDSVSSFVYNQNWGHFNDNGFIGYWFRDSVQTIAELQEMKSMQDMVESLMTKACRVISTHAVGIRVR